MSPHPGAWRRLIADGCEDEGLRAAVELADAHRVAVFVDVLRAEGDVAVSGPTVDPDWAIYRVGSRAFLQGPLGDEAALLGQLEAALGMLGVAHA